MAKNLLKGKGLEYTEVVIGRDISREDVKEKYPQQSTAPIIWKGDEFIGTYENLVDSFK
jgi:glutaredoxin